MTDDMKTPDPAAEMPPRYGAQAPVQPHDMGRLASFLAQAKEMQGASGMTAAGFAINRHTIEGLIVALEDRARFRDALEVTGSALNDAIGWLTKYAEGHEAKGTPDADAKAATNRRRVERLTRALAVAKGMEAGGFSPHTDAELACGFNPGDIASADGMIEGIPNSMGRQLILNGIVWLTREQAAKAAPFGWEPVGEDNPDARLVQVKRGATTDTIRVPGAPMPTMDIYEDARGDWRWRLKARNGRVIADSAEGYVSRTNARRAAETVRDTMKLADITD